MRVLFTCHPAYGHYTPMVPLARAFAEARHEVVFATADPLVELIRRDGFTVELAGPSMAAIRDMRGWDRTAVASRQGRMLAFSTSFADLEVPPRVEDLRRLVRSWRPQLIVHESAEYAGPLVAELEGLPSANHAFGVMVHEHVLAAAGDAAAKHWLANGHPAPDRGGMFRGPYLDIVPPSMQYPHIASVPLVQRLRPIPLAQPGDHAPGWMLALGARPVVLVTFGTVFNERPQLFRTVVEGVGDLDVDVVVATGSSTAMSSLGKVPPNVQVHEWVAWRAMLERSSVVVCHGGASSTLGPLYFGIPLVIVPLGADHFVNAEAARNAGVATVLEAETLTASDVALAANVALTKHVPAARRIAGEIAAMPSPAEVVGHLEDSPMSSRRYCLGGRSCHFESLIVYEATIDLVRDSSSERSYCFRFGVSSGHPSSHVLSGWTRSFQLRHCDPVQRNVELAVASAIQTMSLLVA